MSTNKLLWSIAMFGIAAIGCETKEAAVKFGGPLAGGGRYILSSEPSDPQTPTDIKESVTEPTLIAVAGRIGAGDSEPFQEGTASFIMSQLPDAAHAEGDPDHADNCPFCKRKLKYAPVAVVRILGDDGKVMSVDARELLGVTEGDVVVVRGVATYLKQVNTVQIDAEGVFIR